MRRFWGPMNWGFTYVWEPRGAARSAPQEKTLQAAALFSRPLSEGLEIELTDFGAANAMLKGDYLRQVVEIVI